MFISNITLYHHFLFSDSTQRPLRRVLSKSKNSKIMSEKNNISEAKVPLKGRK